MADLLNFGGQGQRQEAQQPGIKPPSPVQTLPEQPPVNQQQATTTPVTNQQKKPLIDLSKGQSLIDQSAKHQQDILHGRDFLTSHLMDRQSRDMAAREGLAKGAAAQRAELTGLSDIGQNILADMTERQLSVERAKSYSDMATSLGQRADEAAARLNTMGVQQRSYDTQVADKVLTDMLAGMDITDDAQRADYEQAYEQAYGVKPSTEELVQNKIESDGIAAQAQWNSYLTQNEALFVDAEGNANYDYISKDPRAMKILGDMFESEWYPQDVDFDPNNQRHREWMDAQIKTGTTTQNELEWQKLKPSLIEYGVSMDDMKDLEFMYTNGYSMDDLLEFINEGDEALVEGGKVYDFSAEDKTVDIDGKEYSYDEKTKEWKLGDKVLTDAEIKSQGIDKVLNNAVGKFDIEEVKYDTSRGTTSEHVSFAKDFASGDDATDIKLRIEQNPDLISQSEWTEIFNNPALYQEVKELVPTYTNTPSSGGDGSRPKQRTTFPDEVKEGFVYTHAAKGQPHEQVMILSSPKTKDWGKGNITRPNRYGETVEAVYLSGPNKDKKVTLSVGR